MLDQLVLHSVSYSGSWGQQFLTVEQIVEKAADLGFDAVMLMAKRPHLSVLDWNSGARFQLRRRLEKRGIHVACLAGYTNFTADLEHPDIPQREFQIQHVVNLAEAASDLGCALVRVFTGYENGAASLTTQTNLIVESLRECAQRVAKFGVTVGVQNHHDIACDFTAQYELIREVNEPNCRAMFDAWAPALQGADLPMAAAKMAPVTVYTTTANYQPLARYRYLPALVNYEKLPSAMQAVAIDEGFIDYASFLSALTRGGFNGPVAYEMCSPLRGGGSMVNLDAHAAKFLDFLRKLRASLSTKS